MKQPSKILQFLGLEPKDIARAVAPLNPHILPESPGKEQSRKKQIKKVNPWLKRKSHSGFERRHGLVLEITGQGSVQLRSVENPSSSESFLIHAPGCALRKIERGDELWFGKNGYGLPLKEILGLPEALPPGITKIKIF